MHHHGELVHDPVIEYKGGKVDVIPGFDTDLFSFRDLDDFAEKFGYSPSDLVYFKSKGMCIEDGVKLLYDDSTVREMIEIHRPLGRLDLFVDHYEIDEVIDLPHESDEDVDKGKSDDVVGGKSDDIVGGKSDEDDDPDYSAETESEGSESVSDVDLFADSDEEFVEYMENSKKVMRDMSVGMNNVRKEGGNSAPVDTQIASDESDFGSWELRSDYSSSEKNNDATMERPKKKTPTKKLPIRRAEKNISKDKSVINSGQDAVEKTSSVETPRMMPTFKIPRKKLPFVKDDDPKGRDACLPTEESKRLEDNLRGEVGYQAYFMPL